MTGGESTGAADEAVLETMDPGVPYTSTELAEAIGCARTTAYKRLQRLAESGQLETKKVGARGRVWWLPVDRATDPWDMAPEEFAAHLRDEQQFRAVFEQAFDAILIADDEAQFVEVNPAAWELFGLPREELLGHTGADFAVAGYDFERAWEDFQASGLDRGLFPLRSADGEERIVEFGATPNILPGRHLSVLRDVTERHETASELEVARERARRYQRSLAADTVIRLDIQLEEDLFARCSARADCVFEFEGVVARSDGQFLHFLTISGPERRDCLAQLENAASVEESRVVFEDDAGLLVELSMVRSPVQTLVTSGGVCRSLTSEGGTTSMVAETGADIELQRLVTEFQQEYPDGEFVAKRTIDRPVVTTRQYRESLRERLTTRQNETLRAAYHGGYFEWPRQSTAKRIASSMGLATTTWLRHLRLAEATLVDWYFDELEA